MRPRILTLAALSLALAAPAFPQRSAAPTFGKLSGTVVDPSGVPQMGATVAVAKQTGNVAETLQLLSNEKGTFLANRLIPGLYTIRVTLAGFLPAFERNVRIEPNVTTILKIELGNIFSSLDALRRWPANTEKPEADEWAWVLRTSSSSRAILRFTDGEVLLAGDFSSESQSPRPHARLEVTSGSLRPGSVSNIVDAPSTAIAYDQQLGAAGRMMFAGQASFERSASAGFATVWLPAGEIGRGPETTLVLRQSNLGPSSLPFRGARMEHNNQLNLGALKVAYGAEFIMASVGTATSSLRPNVQVTYALSPAWQASVNLASRPWAHSHRPTDTLRSALEELDAFPTILMRDGRPLLEGGWHEEISLERRLGANASLTASVFRDSSRHTAVFGRGSVSGNDFMQDYYSDAFVYDGGQSGSVGTRIAYRQKLSDGTEVVVLYSWAGALIPQETPDSAILREVLETRRQHSVATRVSTRLQKTNTILAASYKWLSGPVVSRQDAFGEAAYQVDPYLNVTLRQPLPTLFSTKIEALADFRNLLAQGYVPMDTADGRVVLVPAFRSIRGGFSFQF